MKPLSNRLKLSLILSLVVITPQLGNSASPNDLKAAGAAALRLLCINTAKLSNPKLLNSEVETATNLVNKALRTGEGWHSKHPLDLDTFMDVVGTLKKAGLETVSKQTMRLYLMARKFRAAGYIHIPASSAEFTPALQKLGTDFNLNPAQIISTLKAAKSALVRGGEIVRSYALAAIKGDRSPMEILYYRFKTMLAATPPSELGKVTTLSPAVVEAVKNTPNHAAFFASTWGKSRSTITGLSTTRFQLDLELMAFEMKNIFQHIDGVPANAVKRTLLLTMAAGMGALSLTTENAGAANQMGGLQTFTHENDLAPDPQTPTPITCPTKRKAATDDAAWADAFAPQVVDGKPPVKTVDKPQNPDAGGT